MNNIIKLIGIGIVICISSCQKNIVINQLPYDSKVSIQCLLLPNTMPKLYLSKTAPYFDAKVSNRSLFTDNALVIINSSFGNDTLKIDSSYNAFTCEFEYFYKGQIITQSNTTYNLLVRNAGVDYNASTTTSSLLINLDSVTYVKIFKDVYGEHEGIVFHFTDAPLQNNYYRYEMHRMVDSSKYSAGGVKSPCLGATSVRVNEIGRSVYSDISLNSKEITFTIEPTFKHALNDTTYLFIQSCDKNMFDFYDQLDKQKLAQFNPFVEPVYLKPTQFSNAIGVFGSYTLSDSLLFVYPE